MDLHNRAANIRHDRERPSDEVRDDLPPGPGAVGDDLDLDLHSKLGDGPSGPAGPGRSLGRACDLLSLLGRQVRAGGDRPAVRGDRAVTWSQVAERVELAAGALAAEGVGPDDEVVLAAEGPATRLIGLLAVARLGAVAVPASPTRLASRPARPEPLADAVLTDVPERLQAALALGATPVVALDRGGVPAGAPSTPAAPAPLALPTSAWSARPLVVHPAARPALDGTAVARRHRHLVAEG